MSNLYRLRYFITLVIELLALRMDCLERQALIGTFANDPETDTAKKEHDNSPYKIHHAQRYIIP